MAYVNSGMSFDRVINLMKYLGYVVYDREGGLTPATMATAKALTGKTEHNQTPSDIATEYAKHNPRFMRGTGRSSIPKRHFAKPPTDGR